MSSGATVEACNLYLLSDGDDDDEGAAARLLRRRSISLDRRREKCVGGAKHIG